MNKSITETKSFIQKIPWKRIKNTVLTIAIICSLLFSFTNQQDMEALRKMIGPIGTNPLQINPTKLINAELGAENMHPGSGTDSLVGHNNSSKMFTMIHRNSLGFATTASVNTALSNYVLSSTLSSNYSTTSSIASTYATISSLNGYVPNNRTLTINGTALDLSANRSWTIPGTTYLAGTGLSLTGNTFANTAPDLPVTLTAGTGLSISGSYPSFTVTNTAPDVLPTINAAPGRSLNTNWTSASRPGIGFYSITCTVTNPLIAGSSTVNAYLEYSTNGGTTWQTPNAQNGNSSAVGVAVAIAITNGQTVTLSAPLVQNVTYRIRTTTTGTASAILAAQSEITL